MLMVYLGECYHHIRYILSTTISSLVPLVLGGVSILIPLDPKNHGNINDLGPKMGKKIQVLGSQWYMTQNVM